ncbi:MAG: glycoside hydrolase family 2 protein, partial [Eubacteriales bacterium]
ELVRSNWLNLNGEWDFEFDFGKTGRERNVFEKTSLDRKINVPFCPESKLSGVEYKDFINACWYMRKFILPEKISGRIILNFEACYYRTQVYINGKSVGTHFGGYTPFSFDITDFAVGGENIVHVYVEANSKDGTQPSGKQSEKYASKGCMYTRSTGIYAPVWLENVPDAYLSDIKLDPDTDNSSLHARIKLAGKGEKKVTLTALYEGKEVGSASAVSTGNYLVMTLPISELHLWEIGAPRLYDLKISVEGETGTDSLTSYFGMRKIELDEFCLKINGKRVFQRLVLDQGYYPDGIYTAPTEEDMKRDIELSMRMGFNGARLHERVFERRFLYNADHMGYIVWGEYANWGFDHTREDGLHYYLREWMEAMERDYNHPALVGWCPLNETWDKSGKKQNDSLLSDIYRETKRFDPVRPCIDTSGNYHVITDIYDIHDYCQDPDSFKTRYDKFEDGEVFEKHTERQTYTGEPFMLSEYGGIKWPPKDEGWGYGDAPVTLDEFVTRYTTFSTSLLKNPRICGLCYTQLYDVEQEVNGIYYYNRTPKFDDATMDILRDSMTQDAAIEKE